MVGFIYERWNLPGRDVDDSGMQFDYDDVPSTNVRAPRQKRKE